MAGAKTDYHPHKCQVCTEEFECDGWGCSDELCRECKGRLADLQPAARTLVEILVKRVVALEKLAHYHQPANQSGN